MAKLKRIQLKASTLLEVIVAMVIIMIVFVIATGIYANIMRSSPSIKQQQGRAMASSVIQQSIVERDWSDKTIETDSVVLQKIVEPYKEYSDLLLITVTALDQGKEIGQSRQITKRIENEPK